MAEPDFDQCHLFEISFSATLSKKLLVADYDMFDLLKMAVENFLRRRFSNCCAFFRGGGDRALLYYGICWQYLAPTSQLLECAVNEMWQYLRSFIPDYCFNRGYPLEEGDIEGLTVRRFPLGQHGNAQ